MSANYSTGEDQAMLFQDVLNNANNIMTVIGTEIALAAYLSTVRHRLIDKLRSKKTVLLRYLLVLSVADAAIVLSAVALAFYLMVDWLPGLQLGGFLLILGLILLAMMHVFEWIRTLKEWW
jgi:hypothetical protein